MRQLLCIVGLMATTAWAKSPGPSLEEALDSGGEVTPPSTERCSAWDLVGGVQLPERPELYARANADSVWGTPTMIQTIQQVAQEMAWQLPDADPIYIGDISQRRGGYFDGHKSHRGGVDADIGLYVEDGRQLQRFVDVYPNDFDAKANWILIRTLLETGNVERIYLDESLIRSLRRYVAAHEGLSQEEVYRIFPPQGTARTWEMTGIVQHVGGHRNHMHVRVLCEDGTQAR